MRSTQHIQPVSPGDIFHHLGVTVSSTVEPDFRRFIDRTRCKKWLVASDFAIRDNTRHNDVFVYTVSPYDQDLEKIKAEIKAAAKTDIKKIRTVDEKALIYMGSESLFSFCFIPSRNRALIPSAAEARRAIGEVIWEATTRGFDSETVRRLKVFQNQGNFNLKLLGDIVLASSFATFITYLLLKTGRVQGVSWMPDRDSITTCGDFIARDLYGINLQSLCLNNSVDSYSTAKLVVCASEPGSDQWFDEVIRIPDYIAGTIAAWNIKDNKIIADHPKFMQVLERVIADNRNIPIVQIDFSGGTVKTQRLVVVKSPPTAIDQSSQ